MVQSLDPTRKLMTNRISNVAIRAIYAGGALLLLLSALKGKHYWTDWDNEHTLFSFGAALTLFVAAEAAMAGFLITKFLKSHHIQSNCRPWLWLLASIAFTFASYDENNIVHERLGYAVARFGWVDYLPISHRDGLFTFFYGLAALVFSAFFIKELRAVPRTIRFYLSGIFLYGLAQVVDVLLPERWNGVYFPQGTEQFCEYMAILSFTTAFVLYVIDRIRPVITELVHTYGDSGVGVRERMEGVPSERV